MAGFVHDKLDDDGHDELMASLDDLLGHPVDVASSCGLGRRDRTTADVLMRQTARLAGLS